jgi:hypothetical protein
MSCSWDVYCLDCKAEAGFEVNHVDKISAIIRHASTLAALYPLDKELDDFQVRACEYGGRIDVPFFHLHHTHRLVPRDEYGQFHDGCDEAFTCGECETRHYCKRVKGHPGKHSSKRDG